jgi:hypothetical protein
MKTVVQDDLKQTPRETVVLGPVNFKGTNLRDTWSLEGAATPR